MRSTKVMVGMKGRTQDSCYELKLRVCSHEVERWVEQDNLWQLCIRTPSPFTSLSSLSQSPCFIIFIPMILDDHLFSIPLRLLIPSILKCHEVESSLLICTVLPALGLCPRCYRYLRNIWTLKEHQIPNTSCDFLCICNI